MKALWVILLGLCSCVTNDFATFYRDATIHQPSDLRARIVPFAGQAEISNRNNPERVGKEMHREGFMLLGFSEFSGGNPTKAQLLAQAKKVGAERVVYFSSYERTETGVMPYFTYNPGQNSQTTFSGTVNGSGGNSSYFYGNANTYSPGSLTSTPIPYNRDIYMHAASFWARVKPGVLGAVLDPLPDSKRQELERNTGVYVRIVVNNSPAFRANLLEGDIITAINGTEVYGPSEAIKTFQSLAGEEVTVRVLRGSEAKALSVKLDKLL